MITSSETPHEAKQRNPLQLAFLGDAVYELLVREYISNHSDAAPSVLHALTVKAVRAPAQREALERISELLTEAESDVVRRGRNASNAAVPHSCTARDYRAATGLEALFGFLDLTGNKERASELFGVISETISLEADEVKSAK